MNLNSLITKITLVFLFTFSLLIAVFIFYLDFEKKQQHIPIVKKYENYASYVMKNRFRPYEVIEYFEKLNFKAEQNHQNVLKNAKIIIQKRGFEAVHYENSYYFHIITPRFRLLLKDLTLYETATYSYYLFALFFVLLILIYMWLIKSLTPLYDLKEKISRFANGDLSITCKSDKKDEIADVANEFDNAVKKIELLLNSRQLFLRTVMHELKTPIAKGRIVSELIDEVKQKNRLVMIFEKLDFLINDFAKVEQIVSNNYKINKQNIELDKVIDNALKMLMIDDIKNKVNIDCINNIKIEVDLELISLCFKNLIDNALKYSINNKVEIKSENKELQFISKGNALQKPLEEYFKPFHNDTTSKNHGMGLGLYIVYSILKMHKMCLIYEQKEGLNIFKIQLD